MLAIIAIRVGPAVSCQRTTIAVWARADRQARARNSHARTPRDAPEASVRAKRRSFTVSSRSLSSPLRRRKFKVPGRRHHPKITIRSKLKRNRPRGESGSAKSLALRRLLRGMVKASSLASLAMSEVSAAFAAVVAQDAQKKTASQGLAATDARREMRLPERESRCRREEAFYAMLRPAVTTRMVPGSRTRLN